MHPALGLGEDWNFSDPSFEEMGRRLHPALGLGEDWNDIFGIDQIEQLELHPALGLGEDWNPVHRFRGMQPKHCDCTRL